jgi:hypothetical protein
MNRKLNRYIASSLLGLALLAGCAAIEEDSTSSREGGRLKPESESESTRSKGSTNQPAPPEIIYRPSA